MHLVNFVGPTWLVASLITISNAIKISSERDFTFPGNNNGQPTAKPPQSAPATGVMGRQVITGQVPGPTGPAGTPAVYIPSSNPGISQIPGTLPGAGTTTCICVPIGSCGTSGDGSGQIDIRIVNNPSATVPPTTSPLTCRQGLVSCCQPGPYRCGVRYPPVQGSPSGPPGSAAYGAYPWLAAILTTADVYIASGALLDARHVLTAAHKVATLAVNTYKVRLGEWDASSTAEPIPAQESLVSRVFVHPNYNPNNLQNNAAIVRLSTPTVLGSTPTIATVCLPSISFAGQRCYVAGWGRNDFGPGGSYQAITKEVDVPVLPPVQCQTALAGTRLGPSFVFNNVSFMCAGGEPGKDACTGDGGAPLVCQFGSRWFVPGLVAWGIGCATGGVPGVYVNVAAYVQWIQTVLNTV